ncbi:hypothetical protein HPULCUR_007830 [Helicostylum pulchrum]|uniref:Uncharacterized protein n=1 Tax=Helicostylum pulchrum TaxID=562976 RepID=A0ABP9Y5V9_9FUNG
MVNTGTLTEGKMGTSEVWTVGDDTLYEFTESASLDPEQGSILMHVPLTQEEKLESMNDSDSTLIPPDKTVVVQTSYSSQFRYALMVSALCNNASVSYEDKEWKAIGDPTEIALTVASEKGKLGKEYWQTKLGFRKVYENAFDSERKVMSCLYSNEEESILMCKGAPEEIVKRCRFYLHAGDEEKELGDTMVSRVWEENARMACGGLRVLALAFKKTGSGREEEEGLTFIGLVGIVDPCKAGVKEAIDKCQEAGICVIMITGDHVKTATAIATQLGIFNPDHADKVYNYIFVFII